MKRRPRKMFKLLLFLLAGAIINVAVAWGCAWFNVFDEWEVEAPNDGGWRLVFVSRQFGSEAIRCCNRLHRDDEATVRDYAGVPWWIVWNDRYGPFGTGESGTAHGWPIYSLSAWRIFDPDPTHFQRDDGDYITVGGWEVPHRAEEMWIRSVPLAPLWPGFAINTIFYAAVLWVLFAAPGAIRRHMRRKRGQCASCGYSLRGNASLKCPECGVMVT